MENIKVNQSPCKEKALNNVKGGGGAQNPSSKKEVKILVCVHKKDYVKSDDVYMPVQGGKAISDIDLGFQGDDTGDNISHKNPYYCELTVQYWAWKNLKNIDYIGLNHYRRYFYFSRLPFRISKQCRVNEFPYVKNTTFNLEKHLGKYDIILFKPEITSYPPSFSYFAGCCSDDYRLLKRIIRDLFPDYYYSFLNVMEHGNRLSYACMFISRWGIFDEYCKWLFSVLEKVEKSIDFDRYSIYQARVLAFMAERLLNVYVEKNKLKVKYYPVIHLTENVSELSLLKSIIHFFKANLSFSISRSWGWWIKDLWVKANSKPLYITKKIKSKYGRNKT